MSGKNTMATSILSQTSKMPCPSISLDAELCKTGSKLAKHEGTVCNSCYALKGNYRFKSVKKSMENRLKFMNSSEFIPKMVSLLDIYRWFRWFDSGDIQSQKMGENIIAICELTPWCNHWIPSKEYKWWKDIKNNKDEPSNAIVRISTPSHNNKPIKNFKYTSTTFEYKNNNPGYTGFECAAHKNKKLYGKYECGDCRACWNKDISNIAYPKS